MDFDFTFPRVIAFFSEPRLVVGPRYLVISKEMSSHTHSNMVLEDGGSVFSKWV